MKLKIQKGFNSVGAVLPDRIKQYKLQKAFYKHQAIRFWQDAAHGFAEELGRETRAIDLKNGILIVACLSKELAYQIARLPDKKWKPLLDELSGLGFKRLGDIVDVVVPPGEHLVADDRRGRPRRRPVP